MEPRSLMRNVALFRPLMPVLRNLHRQPGGCAVRVAQHRREPCDGEVLLLNEHQPRHRLPIRAVGQHQPPAIEPIQMFLGIVGPLGVAPGLLGQVNGVAPQRHILLHHQRRISLNPHHRTTRFGTEKIQNRTAPLRQGCRYPLPGRRNEQLPLRSGLQPRDSPLRQLKPQPKPVRPQRDFQTPFESSPGSPRRPELQSPDHDPLKKPPRLHESNRLEKLILRFRTPPGAKMVGPGNPHPQFKIHPGQFQNRPASRSQCGIPRLWHSESPCMHQAQPPGIDHHPQFPAPQAEQRVLRSPLGPLVASRPVHPPHRGKAGLPQCLNGRAPHQAKAKNSQHEQRERDTFPDAHAPCHIKCHIHGFSLFQGHHSRTTTGRQTPIPHPEHKGSLPHLQHQGNVREGRNRCAPAASLDEKRPGPKPRSVSITQGRWLRRPDLSWSYCRTTR